MAATIHPGLALWGSCQTLGPAPAPGTRKSGGPTKSLLHFYCVLARIWFRGEAHACGKISPPNGVDSVAAALEQVKLNSVN
jgi:hypothetical protein